MQRITVKRREPSNRSFARPVECQQEGAFRREPLSGGGVVDRGEHGFGVDITGAAFDANRPLCDSGQHQRIVDRGGGDVLHAQPVQAGHRKEGAFGHAIGELFQTGLHVAAEFDDPQVGALVQELRAAAQAGGAHHSTLGQLIQRRERRRNKGIAGVFAREIGVEQQAPRLDGRHVFHRVDRNVDLAGQQVVFDFARKQTLAADILERAILNDIAGHFDHHDFESRLRDFESCSQTSAGFIGLGHRQRRAAGTDAQRVFGGGQVHSHGPSLGGPI